MCGSVTPLRLSIQGPLTALDRGYCLLSFRLDCPCHHTWVRVSLLPSPSQAARYAQRGCAASAGPVLPVPGPLQHQHCAGIPRIGHRDGRVQCCGEEAAHGAGEARWA
ncbi:hypothetical protein DUNSADRAFT_7084 [Dunaliella salina]|uniref:Encoded protein n=1 Tax=Dunaliella salina TaxID=3046 RepID=A0ABQ7H6I8_DUNSA|nr:hypothetical protein DUNSADRAFT_7084 [Dunaliella salina]|eukprot:KAF5842474.1 hypothetical protein DUNSADRAFT_7084 [Dunaliella salina]